MGPMGLIHTWTMRPTIRASWSTKGPQRVPPVGPVGLMGPPWGLMGPVGFMGPPRGPRGSHHWGPMGPHGPPIPGAHKAPP